MKKVTKKVYAIFLIILMLMNYLSIIVNAVETQNNLILELVSDATEYNVDDEIIVELKASDLGKFGGIRGYDACIEYDTSKLQLLEIIGPEGYNNSSIKENKTIVVSIAGSANPLEIGETICTLKFKALTASTTPTTIRIIESDVTCTNGEAYFEDENVNIPEITLPVEKNVVPHNLKIIKTDESGNAITNNRALFKITKLDGQVVYQETDENGVINIQELQMPTTEAPYMYTIEEILAPNGYVKVEEPIQVTVTFDSTGNVITALSNSNGIANVISESNMVEVKVLNTAKEAEVEKEVFNLILNKVDEENNSITSSTAEFTITMPDGTKQNYSTNANGKTDNIAILAPEEAGTYTYLVKETKAPNGYIIEESNIILEFTYEKQNNKIILSSGKIVSYNDEDITISNEDVRTATANIRNEKQLSTYNYTINIDKTDEQGNNITSSNAVFEISKNDKAEYIITNTEGKASYNFIRTSKEIVPGEECIYTLKEIKAPDGYILDETVKTIKVTFNSDGTISSARVNENNIEYTTNELNIRVVNEKEPEIIPPEPQDFKLIINKVNEEGQTITAETKYTVTLPNGTQIEYSTTGTNESIPAPEKAGTYVYVLTEKETPTGYVKGDDIVLKLTFDEIDGKIVLVSGNNGIEVTEQDNIKVGTLNILTKKETITYNYSININKVKDDNFKTNITEDIAIFELITANETQYIKTNPLGKATYEFSITNKEIIEGQEYLYRVKEVKAPNGYVLDETEKIITITFNSDGTINTANVNGTKIEKINNTDNVVNVMIINEQKEEEIVVPEPQDFKLVINKVDEEGQKILAETKYTITTPNGRQINYTTTGDNESLPAPKTAGTYVYALTETKTPEGYKKADDIVLKLTFEEVDGKIVLVSGNNGVEVTEEEGTKVATLNIESEKNIITYNYSINIDKVDEEKQNIASSDAIFEITAQGKVYYLKANAEGKMVYEFSMTNKEIVVGQEYVYTLKEVKAPNGYILDETTKTITITFNENGTINTVTVTGEKIEKVNNISNAVNVKVINEKEQEVTVLQPQDFDLVINKIDESNNLITTDSANFVLTTSEGTTYTLATESGTTTKLTLKAPENAGKMIYLLKETKAPEGYNILQESLVIEANFVEVEGKIVLSSAKIKEYNKDVTPLNNTLTIDVTNKKHIEVEEPGAYVIKVSGVDKNNNLIENGTTVVKLTNKLTGEYIYKEVPIKNGNIELEIPKTEGTITYELEQIKAPEGYEINPNPVEITVDFNKNTEGKNKVSNYTVTGEDAFKGTSTEENVIEVILVNNEIKVEPEKQSYSLEINKLDSITKELITEGSAIFTVVDAKGNTKEYGTTSGKILINGIVTGNIGESHTFVIKEKIAPEGYKETAEVIIVKVSFEEIEGKIVCTSPELIMGDSVAKISKTETGNIKIDITNEKEYEDLYVISKKNSVGTDIYDVLNSYTGGHYSIDNPFIDTKVARYKSYVLAEEFIGNLESNGHMEVLGYDGNPIGPKDHVGTGMTLRSTLRDQELTFTIVVKGDADYKDGEKTKKQIGRVSTPDLDKLINHIAGIKTTDSIALRALDLDLDGRVRNTDLDKFYDVLSK